MYDPLLEGINLANPKVLKAICSSEAPPTSLTRKPRPQGSTFLNHVDFFSKAVEKIKSS
jgi:hypothetical protein